MSSRASLNHVYRTVWNQALGCTVAVAENATSHGGVGGRPVGIADRSHTLWIQLGSFSLAVALCWSVAPLAYANPTGGIVIQGQATFDSSQPNKLLVTTQNGAGTNSSAINWQSFSIPAGSATRIEQPSTASMSINRVVTNTPSALFGTLSSNGKVVLVNQSGIAVGAGAVVDTAGFTASAVGMTEADAIAGRLRFSGDKTIGDTSGALSVQGNLIARGGDVVLVAPSIDLAKTAVVEAVGGSVVLAAGQSVEVTGRGLEGITMQVQAPADQAVNLGSLRGDAVGIFAGTLKHSGVIHATQASVAGGKVLLKASGEAVVEGAGQIIAVSSSGSGGRVEVLGSRVALADNANIDVSGSTGGGTVLIGGDAHGDNPNVQNAQKTFVGAGVRIGADATESGNGGKVVVWADDSTQFNGNISAKGGARSGDGGWVETSGKKNLGFAGRVDTTAPNGATGNLLLDPSDITIGISVTSNMPFDTPTQTYAGTSSPPNYLSINDLVPALNASNITVTTASPGGATGNITVSDAFGWSTGTSLKLVADNAINVNASISGTGFIGLKAGAGGISNSQTNASIAAGQLEIISAGPVSLMGTTAIKVDTLAANVTGSLVLEGSAPNAGLTIGTVGSTTGLTATGGITLHEYGTGKSLQINQNVSSGASLLMSGGSGTATVAAGKTVSAVASQLFAQGGVAVNGTLSGSSNVNLHSSGGSITTGSSGLVSAPQMDLQNDASASGDIGSSGSPLKTSGSNLYIGPATAGGPSGVYISNSGNLTLLRSSTLGSAPIQIYTSGNLNLSVPVSSSASVNPIILAASGNFSDGGNALTASGGGRWLVYSTSPTQNSVAGTASSVDFQQYGAVYPATAAQSTGNGFLYSGASSVVVPVSALVGSVTKVYDGTATATLLAGNYSLTPTLLVDPVFGNFTPSSLTVSSAGNGTYAGVNAGSGIAVTSSGGTVNAVFTGNPGKNAYGYTLGSASAAIGVITPVGVVVTPVSGSLVGTSSKAYDGTTVAPLTPGNFRLSGFIGSDSVNVTKTTGTYADQTVGTGILVSASLASTDFTPVGSTLLSNYALPSAVSGNIGIITQRALSTWTGAVSNAWNAPGNWDALPVGVNVASVSIPAGSTPIVFDSSTGSTILQSLSSGRPLQVTGGSLLVVDGLTAAGFTQSGGTVTGQFLNSSGPLQMVDGSLKVVNGLTAAGFTQSGGSVTGQFLNSTGPLQIVGGTLQLVDGLTAAGFTQSGGTVSGTGAFKVVGDFNQTGGTVDGLGSFTANGAFSQSGGSISMGSIAATQSSGTMTVNSLKAATVNLTGGSISETAAGGIEATTLTTASNGGTVLTGAGNKIGSWSATNSDASPLQLLNKSSPLILAGISTAGPVSIENTGGISLAAPLNAPKGKVKLVAHSPITIGTDGLFAGGDIELIATNTTSAGNIVINGPVESSAGSVSITAANDLTQNGTVFGALGVYANVGGVLTFTSSAKSGITPVSYAVDGKPVAAPPSTEVSFDQAKDTAGQTNLVTTFLDKFATAVQSQNEEGPEKEKDKARNELVVEGEICRP